MLSRDRPALTKILVVGPRALSIRTRRLARQERREHAIDRTWADHQRKCERKPCGYRREQRSDAKRESALR
jgi:hypothetical protein